MALWGGRPKRTGVRTREDRFLTVLYYFNAQKTFYDHVPLLRAKIWAGIFSFIAFWSMASVPLMVYGMSQNHKLKIKIRETKANILEQQLTYEGIDQKTHPITDVNTPTQPISPLGVPVPLVYAPELPQEPLVEAPIPPETAAAVAASAGTSTIGAEALPVETKPQAVEASTAVSALPEAVPQEPTAKPGSALAIQGLKHERSEGAAVIRFDMQNRRAGQTRGYFWGVLTYTDAKGETSRTTYPQGLTVTDDLHIGDYKQGESFAARRFRKSVLTFADVPPEARLNSLTLMIVDRDGKDLGHEELRLEE